MMNDCTGPELTRPVFPNDLFSRRYKHLIEYENGLPIDRVSESVGIKAKRILCEIMLDFREPVRYQPSRYDPWTENTDVLTIAIERLNDFFEYPIVTLWSLQTSVSPVDEVFMHLFTPFLFDLIELQYDELSSGEKNDFKNEINASFCNDKLPFRLSDYGLVDKIISFEILTDDMIEFGKKISEPGLKDLINIAIKKHMQPDPQSHKDAVEKIWDVFERLKTYYTSLGKRHSAEKIIENVACGQNEFRELLTTEFRTLTVIGNDFRIRHHETNKTDIIDIRHYDYLFNRCLSLVVLALQYLEN